MTKSGAGDIQRKETPGCDVRTEHVKSATAPAPGSGSAQIDRQQVERRPYDIKCLQAGHVNGTWLLSEEGAEAVNKLGFRSRCKVPICGGNLFLEGVEDGPRVHAGQQSRMTRYGKPEA